MKKFILGLSVFFLVAYSISDNVFRLGSGASDKSILFDTGATNPPAIKWNNTDSKIQFSNDGTNFLNMGSGTGGGAGINLALANGDFESGTNNWTNTGSGSFSITSVAADVALGVNSGLWDAAAASDLLAYDAITVQPGLKDTQCHASFMYKGGDANITAKVVDGSANLLASLVLQAETDYKTPEQLVFVCPTYPETVHIEFEASADAAAIYLDNVFFGVASTSQGSAGGWKIYDETTVTFSSTPAGWALRGAQFQPYKDPVTGGWRMRFNIAADATASTNNTFNIDGVVFKNFGTSVNQPLAMISSGGTVLGRSYAVQSTGTIAVVWVSNNSSANVSGDVALESKPTWADFNGSVNIINDDMVYANERFKSTNINVAQLLGNGTDDVITSWVNTESNPNFDGTSYTIQSDGRFKITSLNTTFGVTATEVRTSIRINNVVTKREVRPSTGGDAAASIEQELDLVKGDTVSISVLQNSGGTKNIRIGTEYNNFTITRINEFSAGSSSGFALADANNAGLIRSESENSFTPELAFSGSCGTCSVGVAVGRYYKTGNNVNAQFFLDSITKGTASGNFKVGLSTSLPLAKNIANLTQSCTIGQIGNITNADLQFSARILPNTRIVEILKVQSAAGGSLVTATDLSASGVFIALNCNYISE